MDTKSQAELNDIIRELRSVLAELESISRGVRKDFVGIGNEQIAACIDRSCIQYDKALKALNSLDTSDIVEGFVTA